eukprot:CAMPEP_0168620662 /NCGR_PEP_ID=MMETSP0449_2-20121227/7265_1 /TAXON_ID=1082188 /ORGANISM="Strombidium rassoulzadegani, Strain ras09" /LENGTH=82 /DNA_ID=CAMNT_0008661699 /DNA_START=471 /DNA_END=719 /DNA_ORIENTATION=-
MFIKFVYFDGSFVDSHYQNVTLRDLEEFDESDLKKGGDDQGGEGQIEKLLAGLLGGNGDGGDALGEGMNLKDLLGMVKDQEQ